MNVLMTGAGAPGAPGIIKCLNKDKNINLFVADSNSLSSGKFLNSDFFLIPNADNKNFIKELLQICISNSINLIFPLVTRELFYLSKSKSLFLNHGIKIIVSDYKDLSIANNKSSLYKHLKINNIQVPEFRVVNNYEEFIIASKELTELTGGYVMKPSISNGSRGVRIVDNTIDEFDVLFNQKPNSLYTTHNNLNEILSRKQFPELLLSENLSGDEYTIDTLVDENGNIKLILPRKRIKIREGISISGEFIEHKEIIEYCKLILKSLNLIGPIGIQVKADKKNIFKVLEINPRIQGTSVSALGVGVNIPLMSVYMINGKNLKLKKIKWGTKFIRYYDEIYFR